VAPGSLADVLGGPLVVAPMAGGPSTPELVAAVADVGALGFLAAGYTSVDAMTSAMAAVRARTAEPFGVNVFVPGAPSADRDGLGRYLDSLRADAAAVGAELGEATWDDDAFEGKVDALVADPPAVVSFTFGCPTPEAIAALQEAGSVVAVTVTKPEEAAAAAAAGADALCVQGREAGAHRGTFDVAAPLGAEMGLFELIGAVAHVTDLPQVAAGGIMTPEQLRSALAAGAVAAQCGTAFLRCPESGAHATYKAALADSRYTTTAYTRAFSGRWARGLVNRFITDHPDAPAAYPEINNATRPLRAAAAARGDADRISLWAGEGYRMAREQPAAEIVAWLCSLAPRSRHRDQR